ncbi:MAG TPA: nitroreductase family deazaflavin-dependent oxidoreductase [Acidimicrobiales bacterium]|nr:nitroreductase family deazaflavin-dependent oxidoreductase [Acidimicrobiales bacterium]
MTAKDLQFKLFTGFHRQVFLLSKGKVAGKLLGMPVVMLTTTGRKSGQQRHSMLTTPLELDGDAFVLVASYGGDDRNPTWYLNLTANPGVTYTMRGKTRSGVARLAEGDEREELWRRLTAAHANYAGYQRKTNREIPVVVIEPSPK